LKRQSFCHDHYARVPSAILVPQRTKKLLQCAFAAGAAEWNLLSIARQSRSISIEAPSSKFGRVDRG